MAQCYFISNLFISKLSITDIQVTKINALISWKCIRLDGESAAVYIQTFILGHVTEVHYSPNLSLIGGGSVLSGWSTPLCAKNPLASKKPAH